MYYVSAAFAVSFCVYAIFYAARKGSTAERESGRGRERESGRVWQRVWERIPDDDDEADFLSQ